MSDLEEKLKDYKPSDHAKELVRSTTILLLVGPTGAGKDAVKEKLLSTGGYLHIVSHTTRPPRINHGVTEKDGEAYHFINNQEAEKLLENHDLIEAKTYSGYLYATSVLEIQKAHDENKVAVTDLEVQGVAEYKALDNRVIAVFLLPPDFKTWQGRLKRRYGDVVDASDHRLRLQTALNELKQLLNTDYYVAVINDDLNETFKQISEIVNSKDHKSQNDPKARDVAEQLAKDIENYLN